MWLTAVRRIPKSSAALFAAAFFLLTLSGLAGATTPDITITDVTRSEGNTGNTSFDFTVSLSKVVPTKVTVDFQTANGTATVGDNDYVGASSTLTIPANTLSATLSIEVVGDAVKENNETFFVNLSNPSDGSITDGQGVGTILDDDPTIWITSVAEPEGNAGLTDFVFEVRLSNTVSQTLTVDFATSDGTAIAGSDYLAASGTLTIPANTQSGTITIKVIGDTDGSEGLDPQTFFVTLTNPSLGMFTDHQGQGSIIDDDNGALGIDDGAVTEFALGRVWPNPAPRVASINYALPRASVVRLTVFDVQGREVAVLVNEVRAAGRHTAAWEGRGAPHGTYFYRIQAGSFVQTRKFTYLK